MPPQTKPRVGITCDIIEHNATPRAAAATAYANAVQRAGGYPVLLPPLPGTEPDALAAVDALILTGGDDPITEPFGEPSHPAAVRVHPDRQDFELTLLRTAPPDLPILGVCLGMQYMALVAGGRLDQHLPETTPTHADHDARDHAISPEAQAAFPAGVVHSKHHQAVSDPGDLAVLARAHDGVIEAIGTPGRRFYLGVQWHPERTPGDALGVGLFRQLVAATRP